MLRFLSDHTYLVEMDREVKARVAQLGYVRWIGDYHPEYRLERVMRLGAGVGLDGGPPLNMHFMT